MKVIPLMNREAQIQTDLRRLNGLRSEPRRCGAAGREVELVLRQASPLGARRGVSPQMRWKSRYDANQLPGEPPLPSPELPHSDYKCRVKSFLAVTERPPVGSRNR